MLWNIENKILRNKPGDEAFRVSLKFPRRGWDQRLADFNRFSSVETRSCYSCLVLYLHDFSSCKTGAIIVKCNYQIIMNFLNHLMNDCHKKRCYFFFKTTNNFIEKLLMKWHISISSRIVSGQLPPRKHAPQSGLGFVLELGLGAIFSEAIVLEPLRILQKKIYSHC